MGEFDKKFLLGAHHSMTCYAYLGFGLYYGMIYSYLSRDRRRFYDFT